VECWNEKPWVRLGWELRGWGRGIYRGGERERGEGGERSKWWGRQKRVGVEGGAPEKINAQVCQF